MDSFLIYFYLNDIIIIIALFIEQLSWITHRYNAADNCNQGNQRPERKHVTPRPAELSVLIYQSPILSL